MSLRLGLIKFNRYLSSLVADWRMALGPSNLELMRRYDEVAAGYHLWYYNTGMASAVRFLGYPITKSVSDLWNYQEILQQLGASLVVEFGTQHGGSALYFKTILSQLQRRCRVLTVDIDHSLVADELKRNPDIEFVTCSSVDPRVGHRIAELRREYPGPVFFILDSDHRMHHVHAELMSLRTLTQPGDYVVVEDSNINGHPVVPGWGPGPYEAVEQYESEYPSDYRHDLARERKFGFTFAPNGFLVRQ